MTDWTDPRHAATIAAYQDAVATGAHPRQPRGHWARLFGQRARRCRGGVMVVDPATGTNYTAPCACPIGDHD
ncbi:hypothetical protein ACIQCG_38840 [Streptomyces noursei]|uniref:hypothetical protein n=1 Tax=Streptomyces noursei TaxID=1971 RepID=UPI003800E12F